jgi:hypothetical protein
LPPLSLIPMAFASGIVDTGGKFAASIIDTGGKFATNNNNTSGTGGKFCHRCRIPVVHVDLRISPRFFIFI